MKDHSVAVCIPTYNQGKYLRASIESAFNQSYPNVKVYVIDDNSSDNTKEICNEFKKEHPDFHYLRNSINLGIAKNVNKILRWPKTDFIVRLDSDDVLHPDYVRTLLSIFQKYPNAGVGHVNIQQIDEQGRFTRKRILSRTTEYTSPEESLKETIYGYKVAANICMFKRNVLEQVNFTDNRPEYTEDYDLWIRIADAGWGNIFSSEILAYYRVWVDDKNYRVSLGRKEAELTGYCRMFEECIEPAFKKREWELNPVKKQRERFALNHAVALKNNYFSEQEKEIIERKVLDIYNSKIVKSRIKVYSNPNSVKAKLLTLRGHLLQYIKDTVKFTVLQAKDYSPLS